MKIPLFVISLIFSLASLSQTITDGVSEGEVADIILNYRDNGIKKFKIVVKNRYNKTKAWKYILYYTFENDSILSHKYRNDEAKFILRNNEISYFNTSKEKKAIQNYNNDYVFKTRDSANVSFLNYYTIIESDTILISKSRTIIDSTIDKTVTTQYYSTDSTRRINKTITLYLKGDTIQTIQYLDKGEGMFLTYDSKKFTSVEKINNQEIYTTYLMDKGLLWNSNPKEYYFEKRIITKVIYYDENRLIKKIVIVNKSVDSKYKDEEVETLIPTVLK